MLDELTELTKKQQDIVASEKPDWDEFDSIIDRKAEIIEKLNQSDDGFTAVFDRIKEELKSNQDKYGKEIKLLQAGIKTVTEKSTSLIALEERTKAKIESAITRDRKNLVQNKNSSKVAGNYYKNMNRINLVDPQLMDSKK